MPLMKVPMGTRDDGTPAFNFVQTNDAGVPCYELPLEERQALPPVVQTGPIGGTVTLTDGTVVDVSADYVEVPTQHVANEVVDLIAQRYADEGHPHHDAEKPFVYDVEGSFYNLTEPNTPEQVVREIGPDGVTV